MSNGKVVHYTDVEAHIFGDSAPGASIRWLIDDDHDNAPTFSLRMIEIAPGGNSPLHTHPYEHENFVVEGTGKVLIVDTWYDLKPGDVAYVPANLLHQYVNTGNTTFKFLCGIPVKEIQRQRTIC